MWVGLMGRGMGSEAGAEEEKSKSGFGSLERLELGQHSRKGMADYARQSCGMR